MRKMSKKWLFAALRLLVCSVALAWVLHNVTYYDYVTLVDGTKLRAIRLVDGQDLVTIRDADGAQRDIPLDQLARESDGRISIQYGLGTTWHDADKSTLLICLVVFAPVTFFQSLRFQWMLRAQEINVTYWESVKLCYAGNFLNFITVLGSTGGDMFKMYYVSLHTDRKTEAVTTVVLDRIVGLCGIILLVGTLSIIRMGDAKMDVLAFGIAVLIMGGLVAYALLFSERLRAFVKPRALLAKLPFASHWRRAESATRRLARHKRLLFGALATTICLQVTALTSLVLAAKALHMRWDTEAVWDYYAYLAGGVVVAAVPISFQGLGTVEAYYKYAFFGTHGTLAAVLCLAMAVRAINLFWSLPGVIVTMTGAYRPRVCEEDVQLA